MSNPELPKDQEREKASARFSRLFELLIGSSLGALVAYSVIWAAFQSLLIGHYTNNDGRFYAAARIPDGNVPKVMKPQAASDATASADDSGSDSVVETGDAMEIWYASAKHRSLLHPCHMDFDFTGINLTNYQFGSDRRTNPHHARYLPVLGLKKNPSLPGPFVYVHFESSFGVTRTYQMLFDFKKDADGKYIGLPTDRETFEATSSLDLNPWECTTLVFVGGTFKIVDLSDFTFIKQKADQAPAQ